MIDKLLIKIFIRTIATLIAGTAISMFIRDELYRGRDIPLLFFAATICIVIVAMNYVVWFRYDEIVTNIKE